MIAFASKLAVNIIDRRLAMSDIDHLNIFNFYSKVDPRHENNLTRAFLVMLKNSPSLFNHFVERIKKKAGIGDIDTSSDVSEILFMTQTGRDLTEHACNVVVPIIITEREIPVVSYMESGLPDRISGKNIADGVICIKPNIALTIEIKPHDHVVWSQVYGHVNIFGDEVERMNAVNLTWYEIVKLMNDLKLFQSRFFENRYFTAGLEARIIDDFIKYLLTYFPQLTPYDEIKYCVGNRIAFEKYIQDLLNKLNFGAKFGSYIDFADQKHNLWVKRFYLTIDKDLKNFIIDLWPADTTNQAKEFYTHSALEKINDLINSGWNIGSNLHLAFMSSNLVWLAPRINPFDYINFWQNKKQMIRQYRRENFQELYDFLSSNGMLKDTELEDVHDHFDKTNRNHINLCPGLQITYKMPIDDALKYESMGNLPEQITQLVNQALQIVH